MNHYRIRYVKGQTGVSIVKADTINGFKPSCDTYVFKIEEEVVAVVPKARVTSIVKVGEAKSDDAEE